MTQTENTSTQCQCIGNNCVDCKCGCSGECCNMKPTECPFLKSHPNWQKCPFMSKMFMTNPNQNDVTSTDANISISDHASCDESKCAQIPMTRCTSCHKTPAFTHTVTLETETDAAADQTEDLVLLFKSLMTCYTKMPSCCRITPESCDCCTCASSQDVLSAACYMSHEPHQQHPHRHEGCSCVHPVIICACGSCTAGKQAASNVEGESSCHGHHASVFKESEASE